MAMLANYKNMHIFELIFNYKSSMNMIDDREVKMFRRFHLFNEHIAVISSPKSILKPTLLNTAIIIIY